MGEKTVMRGCSWPLFSCPSTILAYSCYSSQFVAFCHISRLSLPFSLSKCRILLLLISHSMKNSCYFCDFCQIYWSPSCPFLFPSNIEFCEICCSCYFCHICCSIFSHRKKNSRYFCYFCELCGHLESLLDLFSF